MLSPATIANRCRLKAVCAFFLLLLAFNCVADAAPAGSAGLPVINMQLKWKHQFQFAGYYAAVEKGFYREEGFEVNLLEAPEAGEPAMEVINGRTEF
ncbi:MAG TPA: ABC transporter substrate-binding protein, partial [Candidatus Rifleibacterium sp.]|nr:ABC transporter substrate-binding protein [Candidatus Rifleibacterium sp.]